MAYLAYELFNMTPLKDEFIIECPDAPSKEKWLGCSDNYECGENVAKQLDFEKTEVPEPSAPALLHVQTVALPPSLEMPAAPSAPDFGGPSAYKYQLVFFMRSGKVQKGSCTVPQFLLKNLPTSMFRSVGKIESYAILYRVSDGEELHRSLLDSAMYGSDV